MTKVKIQGVSKTVLESPWRSEMVKGEGGPRRVKDSPGIFSRVYKDQEGPGGSKRILKASEGGS